MKVVLFMRRPRPHANWSVELLVQSIVDNLSDEFEPVMTVSRFYSNGVFRRLFNMLEAAMRQGDVNHVTGDVNFLTYLLRRDRTLLTVLDCGRIDGEPDLRKRVIRALWFSGPVRRCAAITVISHAVKEQLLRHVNIDPDKIHVVPVAVPSLYRHIPKQFNTERPRILQIGGAVNKNRERLFEALKGIDCQLDLVGELTEAQRKQLERNGTEYQTFRSLSNEEMLDRYAACDLVAFPSTSEGFGMPIIEGNLVGRPVLTGNVTSMPEVAGNAACLVDPYRIESIRAGILRIIEEPDYRASLVANGFKNAERYAPAGITAQYEELYRQLVSRTRLP